MPTLKNLQFSGRVGPVIFYFVGDKFHRRSAPTHIRQTAKTKIRSTNFGIASRAGKTLRSELLPVLAFPKDKLMQSRFSGAIAKWLQLEDVQNLLPAEDLGNLYNFRFNLHGAFPESFRVPYTISKVGNTAFAIQLPAFMPLQYLKGPEGTVSVDCTFAVAGCNLASGAASGSYTTTLAIPYNNTVIPAQTITLPFAQNQGSLIVIAAALTFTIVKEGTMQKNTENAFMPSSVIKSYYL